MNNRIEKEFKSRNSQKLIRILNLIKPLNSIHAEINKLNNNYWSKYLLLSLLSMNSMINMCLYNALFGGLDTNQRIFYFYIALIFVVLLIFILNTASSVSSEANKSYKLLNKLFVFSSRSKISRTKQIKV